MKNLTVVIVTYKTPEKIILDCLRSIDSKIKVLIVENSEDLKEKAKKTENIAFGEPIWIWKKN